MLPQDARAACKSHISCTMVRCSPEAWRHSLRPAPSVGMTPGEPRDPAASERVAHTVLWTRCHVLRSSESVPVLPRGNGAKGRLRSGSRSRGPLSCRGAEGAASAVNGPTLGQAGLLAARPEIHTLPGGCCRDLAAPLSAKEEEPSKRLYDGDWPSPVPASAPASWQFASSGSPCPGTL